MGGKARSFIDWRSEIVRYAPFAIAFSVLELCMMYAAQAGVFASWQRLTAEVAAKVLHLLSFEQVISGASIVTSKGMVTVDGLCLPISPLALGIALVGFQTRLTWRRRVAWAAALVPVMALVASFRVALVAALMDAGSPWMSSVHESITPVAWMAIPVLWWLAALRSEPNG